MTPQVVVAVLAMMFVFGLGYWTGQTRALRYCERVNAPADDLFIGGTE